MPQVVVATVIVDCSLASLHKPPNDAYRCWPVISADVFITQELYCLGDCMKKNESINGILTRDVISVHVNQKLSEVNALFKEQPIHHMPVLDGNEPVGIITTHDIFKLIYDVDGTDDRMADAMLDHQFSISDIMQSNIKTINTKSNVKQAAAILQDSSLHSVLVVDDAGDLAGIVTSTDLIRYLLEQF
jgi:CBS domain-containing protein